MTGIDNQTPPSEAVRPQTDSASEVSSLRRAAVALRGLRAQVDALKQARSEPIAIVGMACRFPGSGDGVDGFWKDLRDGRDCMSEVPPDRWDIEQFYSPDADAPGKMYTRHGGFIRDIDKFDASFFGIHPREAERIDPQQRMVLETAWEALEHAGIAPDRLVGSMTGVFFGLMTVDYLRLLMGSGQIDKIDPFAAMANGLSFPAGRLSYSLGLQGPSMVVATACSSSLVAIHLASQALRNRECDLAVAGGVNAMLSPEMNMFLTKTHVLAPDSRSKAFDASADGYSRGEGCGAVVLMRASDAEKERHTILALIRGSAVNHCGMSGALTVPSGPAQEKLIREALRVANVTPDLVSYVETHGTGTPLGDPIELRALNNVMREGHSPQSPCWIGSVKTNIGHLEAAAGIASVIKTVLALNHEEIPPHLHFHTPTPHVPWQDLALRVVDKVQPWPRSERPRIAGVSSFGLTGINAHVLIADSRDKPCSIDAAQNCPQILTLSAKTETSLRSLADRMQIFCDKQPSLVFGDVCFTANTGRAALPHRLALVADSMKEAHSRLKLFLSATLDPSVFFGRAGPSGNSKDQSVAARDGEDERSRLRHLCAQWVTGHRIDWQQEYRNSSWRKVPIPTYPFERKRYWAASSDLFRFSGQEPTPAKISVAADLSERVSSYFYRLAWRPGGEVGLRPAAPALPETSIVSRRVSETVPELKAKLGPLLAAYRELIPLLEKFTADSAANILSRMGWPLRVGQEITIEALTAQLGVTPSYEKYLARMLEICAAAGYLQWNGKSVRVLRSAVDGDRGAFEGLLRNTTPSTSIESELLARCVAGAPAVLQGKLDPVELLFARDQKITLDTFYTESPAYRALNELIQSVICSTLKQLGGDRRLRVLEVGAGTGATTSAILPLLPAARAEYVFTDISPAFLAAAAERFATFANFHTRIFDVERPGPPQGLAPGQYDLVFAINVLHATQDLRRSTRHLVEMLAPGGMLVIAEGTSPQGWLDLMFGLLPGWWKFNDRDLRPSHPLLGREQWLDVLREAGCSDVVTIPGRAEIAGLGVEIQQAVLVGRTPRSVAQAGRGFWLVFGDGDIDRHLQDELHERGEAAVCVRPGSEFRRQQDGSFLVDPSSPSDMKRLCIEAIGSSSRVCRGILYLWGVEPPPIEMSAFGEAWQRRICGGLLHLVRGIAQANLPHCPRLAIVTKRAVTVEDEPGSMAPHQATLWGLGRVIAAEHPELNCKLIDLSDQPSEQGAIAILDEAARASLPDQFDTQVAIRARQRRIARIVRHVEAARAVGPVVLSPSATYAITGGFGGLGLLAAKWMVDRGARHIALIGRRGPDESGEAYLAQLEAATGASILRCHADVTDPDSMRKVFELIGTSGYPLRGLLHAAGVLETGPVSELEWPAAWSVMAAKVTGMALLQELMRGLPLAFVVLFSSGSALIGEPGTAAYAAGNALLDATAHALRRQGIPAVSINWGEWSAIGMAKAVASSRQSRRPDAIVPTISAEEGLHALEAIIASGVAQSAVLPGDVASLDGVQAIPESIRSLLSELSSRSPPDRPGQAELSAQLLGLAKAEREDAIAEYLREVVAATIGTAKSEIAPDANIINLDVDSLAVMEILNRLKQTIGLTLYPRELYERPTIRSLAGYLAAELERSRNPVELPPSALPETKQLERVIAASARAVAPVRNPPMAFILSSPRAGSTLLRVMLAGHPRLFCPPELHLLPFAGMRERARGLEKTYFGEGLQRALMELRNASAGDCAQAVQSMESDDTSIQEVYAILQKEAAPRLLVDKTPAYAASLDALKRAEMMFEDARYICLIRHPLAVIESFVRMRFDKLIGAEGVEPYRLAEEVWYRSYDSIQAFIGSVGPQRCCLVRYEELVRRPDEEAARICAFLGLPFDDAVLRPYQGRRMHDGVHPQSAPLNDPNFMNHSGIEPELAERWRTVELPNRLSERTRQLAEQFGYEIPSEARRPYIPRPTWSEREIRLTAGDFSLCEWGKPGDQLVLLVHGLLEHGAAWELVGGRLAELGYHVLAPDLRGHGRSTHTPPGVLYHPLDFLGDLDEIVRTQASAKPINFVGHSMGAAIAALFASARPHCVRSLVLVEAPVEAVAKPNDPGELLSIQLDYLASPPRNPVFNSIEEAVNRLRHGAPSLSPQLARALAERATECAGSGVRWRYDARLAARAGIGFGSFAGADPSMLLRSLQRLSAPISLVYGRSSNLLRPEHAQMQRNSLPSASHFTLNGGHNLYYDAPSELAEIIARTVRAADLNELHEFRQAGE